MISPFDMIESSAGRDRLRVVGGQQRTQVTLQTRFSATIFNRQSRLTGETGQWKLLHHKIALRTGSPESFADTCSSQTLGSRAIVGRFAKSAADSQARDFVYRLESM